MNEGKPLTGQLTEQDIKVILISFDVALEAMEKSNSPILTEIVRIGTEIVKEKLERFK